MSANKVSYIWDSFGYSLSPSTCLRMLRALPITISADYKVVGIDDWALKKGVCYGSIIVDSITGKTIDLISSRNTDDVKCWLQNHPSIQYVTRDRASGYSAAISEALPERFQIADKFHLVKNLNERIHKEVSARYTDIKKDYIISLSDTTDGTNDMPQPLQENITIEPNIIEYQRTKKYQRTKIIQELKKCREKGMSRRKAAKWLGIHECTADQYWDENEPKHSCVYYANNYMGYMHIIQKELSDRIEIKMIYKLIVSEGFRGCLSSFYDWFKKVFPTYKPNKNKNNCQIDDREKDIISMKLLMTRRLSIHVTNPSWGINLKNGKCSESHQLAEKIIAQSTILQELRKTSLGFRAILHGNFTDALQNWIEEYSKSQFRQIRAFVSGIKKDQRAIENAIIYPWNNGIVEGSVNRLKTKTGSVK